MKCALQQVQVERLRSGTHCERATTATRPVGARGLASSRAGAGVAAAVTRSAAAGAAAAAAGLAAAGAYENGTLS